ncbi:MAG: sulfatase-like hydrolase/transferase [Planctomycetota bacterium]
MRNTLPSFFVTFLLFSSTVVGTSAKIQAQKPNVLILFTDDQRADTIAALGNDSIITPNLDELANRGCNVSSAYCLGANMGAVCRPSRNMLLSGRTYFRWANPTDGSAPQRNAPALDNTLPATFGAAGYETYHHGKQGNTAENIHRQFTHSHYLSDFDVRWSMEAGREIVDDAIDFLGHRDQPDAPWLMYLAFATPHDPRAASPEALSKYNPQDIPVPAASREAHPFDNGATIVRDEWTAVWPRTEQVLRDQMHDYYATITTIDTNIGRLIAELKRRGEFTNTIIVFSSDHGLAMGSHGLMGKQNVYEDGYKAPMLISGPGLKQGSADDPVYLMDLFPTLCDLAGLPIPEGLDGKSFAAMVMGDHPGPRESVMLSYTDVQRSVRHQNWKLIRYPQINRNQLFDLQSDPHELNDLADEAAQAGRIEDLLDRMRILQAEQGDDLELVHRSPGDGIFVAPKPRTADVSPPVLSGDHGPRLKSTSVTADDEDLQENAFTVMRPKGGHFIAISVGLTRTSPVSVSGLRFDIVGPGGGDSNRYTVVAGDPDSRWTPLLDAMNPKRQPVGIHGSVDGAIRQLGFVQSDGRFSPAVGPQQGSRDFDLRFDADGDSALGDRFRGFHGTFATHNGQVLIGSLGILSNPN